MILQALWKASRGSERPGHKYIVRKPDGKGGWTYEYVRGGVQQKLNLGDAKQVELPFGAAVKPVAAAPAAPAAKVEEPKKSEAGPLAAAVAAAKPVAAPAKPAAPEAPKMREMYAKFPSRCAVCGGRVNEGDKILWSKEHGTRHAKHGQPEAPKEAVTEEDLARAKQYAGFFEGRGRPASSVGQIKKLKEGWGKVVKFEAHYIPDDAMSMGYPTYADSGWAIDEWIRPATAEEAAPHQAAEDKVKAEREEKARKLQEAKEAWEKANEPLKGLPAAHGEGILPHIQGEKRQVAAYTDGVMSHSLTEITLPDGRKAYHSSSHSYDSDYDSVHGPQDVLDKARDEVLDKHPQYYDTDKALDFMRKYGDKVQGSGLHRRLLERAGVAVPEKDPKAWG